MKNQKTILLIDDDTRNTFALSSVLRSRGYHCIAMPGMAEALHMLNKENDVAVDLILMDMMMPGMDGYEAIPIIKSTGSTRHIPVIAVTARAMPGDREECLAVGADNYISKPVDIDILIALLEQYLS